MIFESLQIGDYFRIPGISSGFYRKASSSHCSINTLLQPIRLNTAVIPLSDAEITEHIAFQKQYLKSLRA